MVDQMTDLFSTTHKVKTQQVIKSRGQCCGDIELVGYLPNEEGPVPLVLDLRIPHDRFGSSSDPSLNGNLHYPDDIDRSLNEENLSDFYSYRIIGKLTVFFTDSGFQFAQSDRDQFHFHREASTQQLKRRVGLTLDNEATLRIKLNIDGVSIISKSHTQPSHSETYRLLTSSLSLGVPVPRVTQCIRGV
jgi:hypothetical protein